jgi:hypothetical protein
MNAKQQKQYELLRKIAAAKGGVISAAYVGTWVKTEFEDRAGRRFLAAPGHVIHAGSWSPHEKHNFSDPEAQMSRLRERAFEHEGEILSATYTNNRTKVECRDKLGNKFWLTPDHIFRGVWSPY